ncbi:MAG TPA: hypothetical protein VNY35_02225 [Solirubrobacteraceae bacterium]|jgi:hypothetical protein|nr:hypothetical protein [Solirubrobacteraceae bacterium]
MARTAARGRALALGFSTVALLALAPAIMAPVAMAAGPLRSAAKGHSLLQSRELWATIDVCNPAKEPDTVGIRGSMPGDGHEKDAMYMRFQLEYLDTKSNVWSVPTHGADSGYVLVGVAKTGRQGGSSFRLGAPKSQPGYTMRGVVTFQWRRAGRVVHQATRTSSAGHPNVAKADPPGYSAAECTIP